MTQIINWEYFSEEICYIKKALKLLALINCIVLKTLYRLIKYFKYEKLKNEAIGESQAWIWVSYHVAFPVLLKHLI